MLKALIFDLDGVIADTEPTYLKAHNKLIQNYNLSMNEDFFRTIMGKTHIEVIRNIKTAFNIEEDENLLLKTRNAYFMELINEKLTYIDGLYEILDYIKEKGLTCALATGTFKDVAEVILKKLGILNCFDYIIYGDEMKFGKPNPWVYKHVVESLNLQSCQCVILEDSPNGIKAGVGALCKVVAVNSPEDIEPISGLSGKAKDLHEALEIIKNIV